VTAPRRKNGSLRLSLYIAFTTLTRIPLPRLAAQKIDGDATARSALFFPLIGLFYGATLFLIAALSLAWNVPILLMCLLVQIVPYALNKFLHFDGLCDVMDAFWANAPKAKRLVILKDPAIGSFALGGMIFFILFKLALFHMFFTKPGNLLLLILVPVFARYHMVLLAYRSRYPRKSGTAMHIIGKIPNGVFIASTMLMLGIVFGIILLGGMGETEILTVAAGSGACFVITLLFRMYSYKKIGGITGDVLGALNEIIEIVFLFAIVFFQTTIQYGFFGRP
jgi:adenosylcobinamide-GDP ribazoletransferase